MLVFGRLRGVMLCGSVLAAPAFGQAATPVPASDPAVASPAVATPVAGKRIYTTADFARFAPKTAYDMLVQVPSFTIRTADTTERGLGQASENVLINGERIANKSGGAVDQLKKVPAANVERIEIVDAASLGIAGLSGQVANIVLKQATASSGQFDWEPSFRAHFAKPELLGGSVSYSGRSGPVDYTLSLKNNPGRGGFGGPILIYDANHVLTERRNEIYHSETENANAEAKFTLHGPGTSIGNMTVGYNPYWSPTHIRDRRDFVTGETRRRSTITKLDGYFFDWNGDYEFALGPGRLKTIGLYHFEHEPLVTTQILRFDNGNPSTGTRLDRNTRIKEMIGRAEYGWKGGRNDWQLSLERAFNSLDQIGRLFSLSPDGEFEEVEFPGGSGKVQEVRYEAIGTLSRPLTSNLDLQVAAGAEISKLERVDGDLPPRKFFRPKGSVTLGWRPADGWDASLKLRRRVGQISFYDFLDQPNLSNDRENSGNPDLVPPQSWEGEVEVGRDLGPWGKTRLRTWYYAVEDIIDRIPLPNNGQGVGNLPSAKRYGFESTSTIQFDPIGWTGAKLDLTLLREWTSVRDPLTREKRSISGVQDVFAIAQLRHDIPHTAWAWSVYVQRNHYAKYYYPTEVYDAQDIPTIAGFYVEHKNVFGMTVRATVDNVFNGRHTLDRVVYTGYRDRFPVSFFDKRDQLVGPLFNLSVKGTF
ncbi:TonB-dependent receptor plug domain-containing protein [Sphingomonas sp. URHD0057]|uniref:TonB-dependent receptor plug domain-containing protein n=1 Tax=Sphingomonas sp. URHD0057 TaxID=1380389 RepID=UPI0006859814|nr:TonB-dependent receptor plug domain-containing protein [Sphingomonas sp. URHD0057]